jgi:hypothetical protein
VPVSESQRRVPVSEPRKRFPGFRKSEACHGVSTTPEQKIRGNLCLDFRWVVLFWDTWFAEVWFSPIAFDQAVLRGQIDIYIIDFTLLDLHYWIYIIGFTFFSFYFVFLLSILPASSTTIDDNMP